MKIKESASKRRLLLFSFLFSPDSPGLDASCMGKRKGKRQPRVAVGRGKEDVALQWNLAPLDRVRVGKGRWGASSAALWGTLAMLDVSREALTEEKTDTEKFQHP